MRVLIDADGCPVVRLACEHAARRGIPVTLVCDFAHQYDLPGVEVVTVSRGADSADFRLVNLIRPGDLVITQDYGVAAMVLGKGAYAIHHSGKRYTNDNIDLMLMERHLAKKARRASAKHHLRGPAKFTDEDRQRFSAALEALILIATNENGGNAP